jgi:hypothetical protein
MTHRQRRFGYRLALAGLAFIAALTLTPTATEASRAAATPLLCIICGESGGVDFLLNILLFIPLGLGLALAGFSWRRTIILAGLLSFSIELLQMKVIAGRDASLSDLLTNTLGAGAGALLAADWRRVLLPTARPARRLAIGAALALVWIWAGTAWALGPRSPVGAPWYGQWAPDLGHLARFPGTPLSVTAGGEPLLPGRALDQARLEDAIVANPSMSFVAILGERPSRLAPVGSIYGKDQHEVALLGQDRQDLVFRLQMRATTLKLRAPTVYLRNGMAGHLGDTVEAEGALRDGAFELRSRSKGVELSRRLPLSASWGWSLITPWESVMGEEVHSLTAFWIIGLVAVLAYWSVLAGGASLLLPPVTILLLLGAIPRAAGFPPAHWTEWIAALLGIMLGLLGSRPAIRARARMAEPEYVEEPPMHAQVSA